MGFDDLLCFSQAKGHPESKEKNEVLAIHIKKT